MIVVVQDANVIFDLLDIGLFEKVFELRMEFHTTDFVLIEEVSENQLEKINPLIENNSLQVHNFSETEISEIFVLYNQISGMSDVDCSVFFLAKKIDAIILTGDKAFKNFARKENVKVHGTLWIMDKLVEDKVISKTEGYDCLKKLIECNQRLPKIECEKKLSKWKP